MPFVEIPIVGTELTRPISYMNAYGPVVIGGFVGCFAQGAVTVLASLYFVTRKKDSLLTKLSVGILLILSFATTLANAVQQVQMTVTRSGDAAFYVNSRERPAMWITSLLANLMMVVVQGLLVWKFITFGRGMQKSFNPVLVVVLKASSVLIVIGVLASIGLAIGFPITLGIMIQDVYGVDRNSSLILNRLRIFGTISVSCELAVNLLTTICLAVEFLVARTGFTESNAILNTLASSSIVAGFVLLGVQVGRIYTFSQPSRAWTPLFPPFVGHLYFLTYLSVLLQPTLVRHKFALRSSGEDRANNVHIASNEQKGTILTILGYAKSNTQRPSTGELRPLPAVIPPVTHSSTFAHPGHRTQSDESVRPLSTWRNSSALDIMEIRNRSGSTLDFCEALADLEPDFQTRHGSHA